MRLTSRDCLDAGYCVKGQRGFFEGHGFDFRQFVREGLPFDQLQHIEDSNLDRAMEYARRRAEKENGHG